MNTKKQKAAAIIVVAGEKSSLVPLYERGTKDRVENYDYIERCHRLPLEKGDERRIS